MQGTLFGTKEKQIQNKILDFLEWWVINNKFDCLFWMNNNVGIYSQEKKCYLRSNNRHNIKGVSDILMCVNGDFVAIEVKSEHGKLTAEQREYINKINVIGGVAFVAKSINDVERELGNAIEKGHFKKWKNKENEEKQKD